MYSVYKQIHPPTGVEHSIYCNFFNSTEKNLVIAGVNQLSVYRLVEDETQKNKQNENFVESKKKKLECLSTYSLFGNIMSMQNVRLTGSPRDSLLLSFSDAKLSVVEYDAATHDLKTLSLHIFEEAEQRGGQYNIQALPVIRVDPDGRCAAMSIYGMKLVVLPFRRDVIIDDLDNPSSTSSGKSPFMSSYIIDLRKLDEKITNVIDFQFLHGYYEPTVLILFEPLQTWAGRVAVRMDTCSIVAISLNVQQRVHPIIWSLNSLPFDCVQVLAVPKPIGGVLVFAVNSLLYLNQSVPPYGVSLNCITENSTSFPLKTQEGVRIALDCAQAALISYDRLVLSLKGGELYVLTLVVDSMRCVRSFHFDKAAASVLTTCMTMCDESYLFLGSRLGNSLLLKHTEKTESADIHIIDKPIEEPPPKKRKPESGDMLASDISAIDNLDELEVYGSAVETGTTSISKYSFEVCDNIWNIAPCGQAVMGEPAFLSEEFSSTLDPDLELVTCSGYGKNGALSVLQRSVRPQVVTTFELPGCVNMWTVFSNCDDKNEAEVKKGEKTKKDSEKAGEEEEQEAPTKIEGGHAFLILSRKDSSMILQTGQEINELDHSGFSTQNPTVFAGNIGNNRFIMQVSPMGVRLLEGVEQLQHIPLDVGSPIVHCSVADPYAVLLSEDGRIILMTLRQDHMSSGARLAVIRPMVPMTSRIVTMCAYRDLSGLFTTKPEERDVAPKAAQEQKPSKLSFEISMDQSNIEDEDELLYGESDTSVFGSSLDTSMKDKQEKEKLPDTQKKDIEPSHWAVICRETGVLEIFSLPDFKLVYYVKSFPLGQKVLVDTIQMAEGKFSSGSSGSLSDTSLTAGEMMTINEVLLLGLGYKSSRPYLLARVDEDLYIYQAFPHFQSQDNSRLKIRFKKVSHNLLLREKKLVKVKKKTGINVEEEPTEDKNTTKLRYFQDISGYSGVFICGSHPHWLFLTSRGSLRFHPMNIDGAITCFAPFCNVNCPRGFLYFNKQGELRICVLPTHLTYDSPWPVRKIPLRCTPHFVAYHTECKIYAVVSSVLEPTNKQPKTTTEEHEYDFVNRDETFVYPHMKLFNCQLYSPSTWEVIPNTRIDIGEFEHVRCLKYVSLGSEETVSGYKGYLVMGTTECYGEEVHSRGRIIIFDIIEVVPEPGQPLTKHKMKIEYDKEQKGPVTAISHVGGFLISAIGQKLYMWSLKEGDLVGVAFIDSHIYIHDIVTIKNLIVAADLLMSISLYRYQPEMRVLSLVSRDVKPLEIYTADFLVDNTQLSFVVSDRYKNICIYVYQPEIRESHGGTRLLRRADFNIGSHINTMFRIRCRLSDPTMDKKTLAMLEKKHITYFATLDGSIGFLLPISEKVYRRLLMLQNSLTSQIPHTAGLNNKCYTAYKSAFPELYNSHKNILDGELLWKYIQLSVLEKTEMAKRIGTTADQLLDDMIEIDRVTAHF